MGTNTIKTKNLDVLKNQPFMDDMYLAFIYGLKTDDLKKIAAKHRVKLTIDLLSQIRSYLLKRVS